MDQLFNEARAELRTVRDLLRFSVSRFNEGGLFFGHGSTNAQDEAAYLILHALHLPPDSLDPYLDARLTPSEVAAALDLVDRRIKDRVPAAYLTNEAWLSGYKFYVDERVIVPRSFLAELILEQFTPWVADPTRVTRALDLCTGSGCLAVLLALAFSYAEVDAIDLSPDALEVAQRNVSDYGLNDQIRLLRSDMFQALTDERYDLIISNPPYVTTAAMQTLPVEYLHEPRMALAAGADGMDFVRIILKEAPLRLKEGGLLFVEVGNNRLEVEEAFPQMNFTWLNTHGGDDHVFMATKEQLEELASRE